MELLGELWVIRDEAVSYVVHIDRSFAMAEKKTRIVPIGIKPFELLAFVYTEITGRIGFWRRRRSRAWHHVLCCRSPVWGRRGTDFACTEESL